MQNYIVVTPRFSDFNQQGLLKASIHIDLACESQLAQMAPRYNLPLSSFVAKGLRWHIGEFKITFPKAIRTFDPLRIEADVFAVSGNTMTVDFTFFDNAREIKDALGTISVEWVGKDDKPVEIDGEIKQSLMKFGRVK